MKDFYVGKKKVYLVQDCTKNPPYYATKVTAADTVIFEAGASESDDRMLAEINDQYYNEIQSACMFENAFGSTLDMLGSLGVTA